MDITFTCKCGQEIAIEEAGAGITVDCPGCGKPVYVPSIASDKSKDPPLRVETPLAKLARETGQTLTPSQHAPPPKPPSPANPFAPRKREDVHPSIQTSLLCLPILAGLFFIGIFARHEDLFAVAMVPYVAAPLVTATTLCAVYGMCSAGQVKKRSSAFGGLNLTDRALLLGGKASRDSRCQPAHGAANTR